MDNYKGIYYNDSKDRRFFEGGAHFRYKDLFNLLISIGGVLHKEKENDETNEIIFKNKLQFNNDTFTFNLEKLIHKSENQPKIKPRTRNVDQNSYINNPNTMNSFNMPAAYKSYGSLHKNNKKQSRNIDVGEYFALDNYSYNKYHKTSNTGFKFNNNNINNNNSQSNDNNINYIYKHGNLSMNYNNSNCSNNLGKSLSNNINNTVEKYNNSISNNNNNKLNNNININININNNYLSCLHNKNKTDLSNSNKYPINNSQSTNKKDNQYTYMKNIPIRRNYVKYKTNLDFNTQKNFNIVKTNNNLDANIHKKSSHNYLMSFGKIGLYHDKSSDFNLAKSNNINKTRNVIRADTVDYGKSFNHEKNILSCNGNYTKTCLNNNEQKKKLNNCLSLIGLVNGNREKKNISYLNFERKEKNNEGIVLQKYIKKKVNQMCMFKNKGGMLNNNGVKYIKKGIMLRNVDGLRASVGRTSSSVFKFNNIGDYISNKKK